MDLSDSSDDGILRLTGERNSSSSEEGALLNSSDERTNVALSPDPEIVFQFSQKEKPRKY